jgi:protein-L-isoaspartate(D-aspartate) O-methyltransferase
VNTPEVRRTAMVSEQLRRRGISDPRVLDVMGRIPRERFIPERLESQAYADRPLAIGHGQTISQPYMVALMSEALSLTGCERVLEVGTGSGYQTAVLAAIAAEVVTVERIPELAKATQALLADMGIRNVTCAVSDGSLGYSKEAPYDRILVAAAAPEVPQILVDQLRDPGILVIPCGSRAEQVLYRVRKQDGLVDRADLISCVFVPLIGKHGWNEADAADNR